MNRICYSAGLGLLALASVVRADHANKPAEPSPENVPLFDNLGDHRHAITTSKPLAQQYFNQGLRLIYGFNHDEAIRAFKAAAKIDPDCAMAHWGIAIALGPNYNLAAEEERAAAAYVAVSEARKLLAKASQAEAAYIEALSTRYVESPKAERKPLDLAYAKSMRRLAARYPDDQDAAVLFAEALLDIDPWELWTASGKPQPLTEEIVSTLEGVLKVNPNHPGANHFYIHAVEASPNPERALPSALRLGGLMPGAGHMVHMPSHIYFRLGRYQEAVEANQRAVEVDRLYIEQQKPHGAYPMMYYPHNIHFLWSALTMEGRSAEAIAAATQVVEKLPAEMVKEMPMIEGFLPTRLYALVRFSKWDDIRKEKKPLDEFTFATGMWHYAQGLASIPTGQSSAAEEHYAALKKIINATPEDKKLMRHSAAHLLNVAAGQFGAALDAQRGAHDAAVEKLKQSVVLQDRLAYDEPPAWHLSMREILGVQLLRMNKPAEAEQVFLEDLKRQPENGWALSGLARSLETQGRADAAAEAQARFEKAWARADCKPN